MNTSHFVLFPIPAWGHLRPFCILATRLVREQENIIVTFIVAPHVLDKTRIEVSRQFLDGSMESSEALQRIRILSPHLSDSNGVELVKNMKIYGAVYPATYETLYQAEPITCSATGTTFTAIPPPCAAIIDYFSLAQLHAIRAVSGYAVPVIACAAAGAGVVIRYFGPESIGGQGGIFAKIDAEATRAGLSTEEMGDKIFTQTEGRLVQIPGLPAMYDYESFPQTVWCFRANGAYFEQFYERLDPSWVIFPQGQEKSLPECDAMIVTTSYTYESESVDAMKQWFSDMQKEVHVLGPLLPAGYGTATQNTEEGVSNDIEIFLQEMLVQHGKRSVFFISFGTIFWPSVPEYIEELIEALIEKTVPFILAHAAPYAKISEQQAERIKSSGVGVLTTWSPQQFILNHPATGWFVTHGGFNGVIESLGSGIPLICWPFVGDQPFAAAHLTENLNVAFELFQVRTGDGLKPIARNGITPEGTREAVGVELRQTIDLCRGEKGQEMRRNAETFKEKFAEAWEADGTAKQEMHNFLHKYSCDNRHLFSPTSNRF